jgi:ubiquinone/menaquinone biosynthesis C-methylase UbiE
MQTKTQNNLQKAEAELAYWEERLKQQGRLSNEHYEVFYTAHFGLEKGIYRGKKILDIGCGPRGSLEWATETALRIGIDPLAEAYRRLGTHTHAMDYVACSAENIPFSNAFFDIVSSFNSMDHVDTLEKAIGEIGRVTIPGGSFLLLTDIHQQPTVMEPSAFSWDIVDRFQPVFKLLDERRIEYTVFSPEGYGDMYQSLQRGVPYNDKDTRQRDGILSARLQKQI